MNHRLIAQVALTLLWLCHASATVTIDFNRTHATNPLWTGHARFHLVWQGGTVVLLAIISLVLLWHGGPCAAQRFYLASLLAALSPLGFLVAFATRKLFGGTLSDPNGISPVRMTLLGTIRVIDLNLVAVLAALLSLLAMVLIYRL